VIAVSFLRCKGAQSLTIQLSLFLRKGMAAFSSSESILRTLKYRPEYLEKACTDFDDAILLNRVRVYNRAKAQNPSRWSGEIKNLKPIKAVHLNP
jgi:hypothetical protein